MTWPSQHPSKLPPVWPLLNRPSWFMLHLNNRVIYVRMTAAHTCACVIRNTCSDVFSFSLQAIWPLYSRVLTSITHSPCRTQWSKVKVNQIHSYYSLSVHISWSYRGQSAFISSDTQHPALWLKMFCIHNVITWALVWRCALWSIKQDMQVLA